MVLSGISGTGKTRLAQEMAALFPSVPAQNPATWALAFSAARELGRLVLPPGAAPWLAPGATAAVEVWGEDKQFAARLGREGAGELVLQLRGSGRQWLQNQKETLWCEAEWGDEATPHFRLWNRPQISEPNEKNHLFVSVRPDWNDGKPLLGYFNPLLNRYEWTAFLRFVLRAVRSWQSGQELLFFVTLDEMNLARVEHYFSDFLSVLESGRDAQGFSREPLRLEIGPDATGEVPPHEIFLPPNLVFTGTINWDETTHPLSPKVLDRAFVLELGAVDFHNYPQPGARKALLEAEKQLVLRHFARDAPLWNAHSGFDLKNTVVLWVEAHPEVRMWLQDLNEKLADHELAFGFRVFDEIATFCAVGEGNGLWSDWNTLFDWAVALKIGSRFRGSRSRLEDPLRDFLSWCQNPAGNLGKPSANSEQLPQSARSARRLLRRLEKEGFVG